MKPVHLVAHKNEMRPSMEYLQVKNGFVYATNGNMLIKIPIAEVFGDALTIEDELYFNAKLWASAKMHSATSIHREDSVFTATKNGKAIGQVKALSAEEFSENVGRYPDVECVIPSANTPTCEVAAIGFNPVLMDLLCKSFGCDPTGGFSFTFYGVAKGIEVRHKDSDSYGLLMPTMLPESDLDELLG